MKNDPAHIIRFGLIKGEIFRRDTTSGAFFNVKLTRMFRNGDQWKESHQFGRDDLLVAAKVLDLAHSWIFSHSAATNKGRNHEQSAAPSTGH
jgi:hypothetical protein